MNKIKALAVIALLVMFSNASAEQIVLTQPDLFSVGTFTGTVKTTVSTDTTVVLEEVGGVSANAFGLDSLIGAIIWFDISDSVQGEWAYIYGWDDTATTGNSDSSVLYIFPKLTNEAEDKATFTIYWDTHPKAITDLIAIPSLPLDLFNIVRNDTVYTKAIDYNPDWYGRDYQFTYGLYVDTNTLAVTNAAGSTSVAVWLEVDYGNNTFAMPTGDSIRIAAYTTNAEWDDFLFTLPIGIDKFRIAAKGNTAGNLTKGIIWLRQKLFMPRAEIGG